MLLSYNIEIALEWRIPYLRAGFHELVTSLPLKWIKINPNYHRITGSGCFSCFEAFVDKPVFKDTNKSHGNSKNILLHRFLKFYRISVFTIWMGLPS